MTWLTDSLLHLAWLHFWQLTALILVVVALTRFMTSSRPHLAHSLWLVVLLKCVTPPLWYSPSSAFCWWTAAPEKLVTLVEDRRPITEPVESHKVLDFENSEEQVGAIVEPTFNDDKYQHSDAAITVSKKVVDVKTSPVIGHRIHIDAKLALFIAWLSGAVVLLVSFAIRWLLFWAKLHRAGAADSAVLQHCLASLTGRLQMSRRIRLLVTNSNSGPAVIGIWNPTIILPAAIATRRPREQLELILAHELIHVRRGDLWWGMMQLIAQTLWWFHPLVWIANRSISREAERCCDEEVVASLNCTPGQYARSLLVVLEAKHALRPAPVFPGVRQLDITSNRLERIMKLEQGSHKRSPWWCWIVILLAASLVLPGAAHSAKPQDPKPENVSAQSPAAPVSAIIQDSKSEQRTMRTYDVGELYAIYLENRRGNHDSARIGLIYDLAKILAALAEDESTQGVEIRAQERAEREERLSDVTRRLREVTGFTYDKDHPQIQALDDRDTIRWTAALNESKFGWNDQRQLAVSDTAKGHERIAHALEVLKQFASTQLEVHHQIFVGPSAELNQLWEFDERDLADGSSVRTDILSAEETEKLKARLAANKQVQQSHGSTGYCRGPALGGVLGGGGGGGSLGQEQFFVVDLRPSETGSGEYQPEMLRIQPGIMTHINTMPIGKRDVRMIFDMRNTWISKSETTTVTVVAGAQLNVPVVERTGVALACTLSLDETLLIGGLQGCDRELRPSPILVAVRITQSDAKRIAETNGPKQPKMDTHVYNVTDLVTLPAPSAKGARSLDRLRYTIQGHIQPTTWNSRSGGYADLQFSRTENTMTIAHTPHAHKEIRELLRNLRKLRNTQVELMMSVAQLPNSEWDKVDPEIVAGLAKNETSSYALSDEQYDDFSTKLAAAKNVSIQSIPEVTVLEGSQVNFSFAAGPERKRRVRVVPLIDNNSIGLHVAMDGTETEYSVPHRNVLLIDLRSNGSEVGGVDIVRTVLVIRSRIVVPSDT